MEPAAAVEDVAEAVAFDQPAPEVDTLAEAFINRWPARDRSCFAETVASLTSCGEWVRLLGMG